MVQAIRCSSLDNQTCAGGSLTHLDPQDYPPLEEEEGGGGGGGEEEEEENKFFLEIVSQYDLQNNALG